MREEGGEGIRGVPGALRPGDPFGRLQEALRRGDARAQGEALAGYRGWLEVLAGMQVETRFQAKFGASDVVQQALLEAHRDLPGFRGGAEAELLAWLLKILAHVIAQSCSAGQQPGGSGSRNYPLVAF